MHKIPNAPNFFHKIMKLLNCSKRLLKTPKCLQYQSSFAK